MDITDIKAENIKKILNILRTSLNTTKRDLAAMTGLSFSTVSNLCNELKDKEILCEEKLNDYSVGRTPSKLIFRCEQFCSICVDLQQENQLNFAVLDFSNRILYRTHFNISDYKDVHQLLHLVEQTYCSLRSSDTFSGVCFVGVGVSVPGIYDQATGHVINVTSSILSNVPLQRMLGDLLQLPCYVDNESNLCALSVRQSHADNNNIVYLHSSAGLGVGVVCDGRLLRGANGHAAEVAHIPLGSRDIRCPFCGSLGCIENDLSQRGMDMLHFPGLTTQEKQQLLQDRGEKLGELMSILVNLFDPTVFYIGGTGLSEYEALAPYALSVLKRRSPLKMERGLKILHDTDSLRTIEQGINQIIYENWNPLSGKH